jgi:hypothetical protein
MRYCLAVMVVTLVVLNGGSAHAAGPSKGGLSGDIQGLNPGTVSGFVAGGTSGAIDGELGQVPITGAVQGTTPAGFPGTTIGAAPPAAPTSLQIAPNEVEAQAPPPQARSAVVPLSTLRSAVAPASVVVPPIVVPKLILAIPPAPVSAPQ